MTGAPPLRTIWLTPWDGPTEDGRPRWWVLVPDGEEPSGYRKTVTPVPPPEGWTGPCDWVPDPTWPGNWVPKRLVREEEPR